MGTVCFFFNHHPKQMRSLNIYKVTESIIVMAKLAQDNGVMGFPGSSACHSTGQARGTGSGDDVFTATEPSLTMRNETGLVWPSHSTDPVLNGGTLSELEPSSLSDTPYMFDSWFRASQTLFCIYTMYYMCCICLSHRSAGLQTQTPNHCFY